MEKFVPEKLGGSGGPSKKFLWPEFFAVKLISEPRFCAQIQRVVDKVREEPMRPRGCYKDKEENVYMISHSMLNKLCRAYQKWEEQEMIIQLAGNEPFVWSEVTGTIEEALSRQTTAL